MRSTMFLFAALVIGCNEETHTHADELGANCTALVEACHDAGESGDVDAEACHDVGHEGDEDACGAELDACVALCEAVVAGA